MHTATFDRVTNTFFRFEGLFELFFVFVCEGALMLLQLFFRFEGL